MREIFERFYHLHYELYLVGSDCSIEQSSNYVQSSESAVCSHVISIAWGEFSTEINKIKVPLICPLKDKYSETTLLSDSAVCPVP